MLSNSLVSAVDQRLPVPAHVAPQTSTSTSAHLTHTVGNTPVVWIDAPFTSDGRGFWAKLEGHNPGG